MSELFKNKYKMIALFTAFVLVISLASGALAYHRQDKLVAPDSEEESSEVPVEENDVPDDDPVVEAVDPNLPSTMRGVFLTPGTDFLLMEDRSEQTVKEEINTALDAAEELTMNTVIVNSKFEDKVIYHTKDAEKLFGAFDVMDYVVKEARERNFYVLGVFDVSSFKEDDSFITPVSATTATTETEGDLLTDNLGEYARNYQLDGILLEGYVNQANQDSYKSYSTLGGAIGFDNYMRQTPEMLVQTAARTINLETPATQVGLLADPVWANTTENESGSKTNASFTALMDGNADTKSFVQNGLVDFVAVNAYGSMNDTSVPFLEVVNWWAELSHTANTPLYIIQSSSRALTDAAGWLSPDELANQALELETISGVRGSIFDNLQRLVDNPEEITDRLLGYYKEEEVEEELILKELEMTKPDQSTYTTNEQQVVFTGASDPEEPVYINETQIRTDASGYFTATYPLQAGTNTFTVTHKEKSITYTITRQIDILTEVAPTGNIKTDGGMEISISAVAYQDAIVTATVGGVQVPLAVDDNVVDEGNRDSTYRTFRGKFTAPAATGSEQNLGAISVTANWDGQSKTLTGGAITVNKKAKIEDGVPVVISTRQAKTYPATTLDNIPSANCYPLPQGAMDYAVGDEIFYKEVGYTVLASGLRVRSEDISASEDYASGNTISGISVDVANGSTYVTLETAQQISFNFAYQGDSVSIRMNNTNSVPEDLTLSKNPLFTSAVWQENTLILSFVKAGGFMGYEAYYEEGALVFRFNNPPASLSGARIAVDPGHGGKDTGALGFLSDYPEKVINAEIARSLAEELQARGAAVLLLDTSGGMDLLSRVRRAEEFNADLFISVHNNTAPNASAHGTEVYYFTPYSKAFASFAASSVSGNLGTNNRGARQSYYHVTLSSQFPSMLVECGFMSNKGEYEKLIRSKYQERIAVGIADAAANGIAAAYTGISGGGSENTDGSIDVEGTPESSQEQGTAAVTGVTLRQTLSLRQGRSSVLQATVTPTNAAEKSVVWASSDSSVAAIESTGKVIAKKPGKATITVTTKDGGFTAQCLVTVTQSGETGSGTDTDIAVEDAQLSDDTITILPNEKYTLTLEIFPEDATNQQVLWKSSDSSIATVNSSGVVTGLKKGSTSITATTVDSGIISTCYVVVGDESSSGNSGKDDLSKIDYIYLDSQSSTMYINSSQTLIVYTEDGKKLDNSSFKWESSDRNILTVDSNGVVKAGRTPGNATITVYNDRYEKLYDSASFEVTRDRVRVETITLNHSELEIAKGTTFKDLKATISPSNATNKEIRWRVGGSSVASIDNNGVITARRAGNTTIIVTSAENPNVVATCRLVVVDKLEVEQIWLGGDFEMWVGDKDYLDVFVEPSTITDLPVTWSSSNPDIVSIDSKGNIEALKEGRARISVMYTGEKVHRDTIEIRVIG